MSAIADTPAATPRLAKIHSVRAGRGSGWAIGTSGVITARHIVAAVLDNPDDADEARPVVEVTLNAAPERSFECEVIWHDEAGDLALLMVGDRQRVTWQTLLRATPSPLLAYLPPTASADATIRGFPGAQARSTSPSVSWLLAAPESAPGTVTAGDTRAARAIVEIGRDQVTRNALRRGLPGAAVLCRADTGGTAEAASADTERLLLGVVTDKRRGRRRVRFAMATLPDPRTHDEFRDALDTVGATAAVVSVDGPRLRTFVTERSLDEAWEPKAMADIAGPDWFGTRPERDSGDGGGNGGGRGGGDGDGNGGARFPFIDRPERAALTRAVDDALAGTGPRVIVVRGPSAAGKSRLVAEVLRSHSALRTHRIVAPARTRSILDLPDTLHPTKLLIWMDDLTTYPATALTHERVRLMLEAHPGTIVIGTVLDSPEQAGSARLIDSGRSHRADDALGPGYPLASTSLSGVHSVTDDETLTATVTVDATPVWNITGVTSPAARDAVAAAATLGLGLGEYLSGYRELADHYTAAQWTTRALIDLVADWDRSGIGAPLPLATARLLWDRAVSGYLPRDELRRFSRLDSDEINRTWRSAVDYATETVLGGAFLVRSDHDALRSSEFSRVHIDRDAIDAHVWDYLLHERRSSPVERLNLGLRALESGTPQRALRAFESILFYRDDDEVAPQQATLMEVIARRGIALYHSRTGRDEQAIMVYTDLVDTFGGDPDPDVAEQVAQALLGIGITFSRLGSHGQAVSAYTELVGRYGDQPSPILDAHVAKGLLGQATTLAELGRHAEEQASYDEIIERFGQHTTSTIRSIVEVAERATTSGDTP